MRPKTLLYPVAMLDDIKRNSMSCQSFPMFPHTSTLERVFSCACVIIYTWKLFITRQKSCEPHLAFIISSHKLTSTGRSVKWLLVLWNWRKRISGVILASGQQHPNTWKRCQHSCLGILPQHWTVCLWKVPRWGLRSQKLFIFNLFLWNENSMTDSES